MSIDKNMKIIDSDDDIDLESLSKHLEEDTKRKKNLTLFEIEESGKSLLMEIERKKKNKELQKNKLIPYIIRYGNEIYNADELKSYVFEDVQDIYNQLKKENRSSFMKFFHFLFNIE